jgi:hypothetical protein
MGKGQMFLISGIVVVIVLILLKNNLSLFQFVENKRYLQSGLETLEIRNIEDETVKIVQMSYPQKINISSNINNFTTFVKSSLKTRTIDLDGVFVETVYSGSTRLNVTVFNFLGMGMSSLSLSLNSSDEQPFSNVADGSSVDLNFTFTSQGNYSLAVAYSTSAESKTEEVIIPYVTGASKFTGFFDVRFASERGEVRDKYTKTIDLP